MLAFIAGTIGTTASENLTSEDFRTCSVTVNYYNTNGDIVYSRVHSVDLATFSECQSYHRRVIAMYQ